MDTIVKEDAAVPDAAARDSRVVKLADGRQLGYAEYGDPHGLPLIAFHGTPGSRFISPWETSRLAREDCGLLRRTAQAMP